MIAAVDRFMKRWSMRTMVLTSVLILLAVVVIDKATGPDVSVAILYIVPVFLISWSLGRGPGLVAAIICAALWSFLEVLPDTSRGVLWDAWNLAARIGVFAAFALVITRVKIDYDALVFANANLEEALNRVKQLSGLLPICSWCKKIRDERGDWHQMEMYIAEHSEADFSHSICPDCMSEHRLAR